MSSNVLNNVPIPLESPIAKPQRKEFIAKRERDPQEGLLTQPWIDYFTHQGLIQEQVPAILQTIQALTQSASIGATDLSGGGLSAGFYRVSYYARVTRAATTSSSLEVTIDWTENGTAQSFTGAAIVGNLTTSLQTGTLFILIDALSPVRYSTTYASVGGTSMQYALYVLLEQVSA